MAYTATKVRTDVFGSQRVESYEVTSDASSGSVTTGMQVINSVLISPVSMATGAVLVKKNTTLASAAANGKVYVAAAASGDVFTMIVFGR